MSSSSKVSPLPQCATKINIIHKMNNVIDMVSKIASISTNCPDLDPTYTVNNTIITLEKTVFKILEEKYKHLQHYYSTKGCYLDQSVHIETKMSANPLFLHPTLIEHGPLKKNIIPLMMFTTPYTSHHFPFAAHVTLVNSFYQPALCCGVLNKYRTKRGTTTGKWRSLYSPPKETTILFNMIDTKNTDMLNTIFDIFKIGGMALQESDALKLLYHPHLHDELSYMVVRDPSILCRSIRRVHPIEYISKKFGMLHSVPNNAAQERMWFDFIMKYISLSIQHYPLEFGFLFVNAHEGNPVILWIMTSSAKYTKNGKFNNGYCTREVFRILNRLEDPTGLFHNILIHMPPHFPYYVNYIKRKGDYFYNSYRNKPVSLLECYCKRNLKYWTEEDHNEIEILYTIFRNWPESITSIHPND